MQSDYRYAYYRHAVPRVRQEPPAKQPYKRRTKLAACILVVIFAFTGFHLMTASAASAPQAVDSGIQGYCLDVHRDETAANAPVDAWECNSSAAQNWLVDNGTITHDKTYCLGVLNNGTTAGSKAVLNTCDGSAGQVWLRYGNGYQNPQSGLCLNVPGSRHGAQLDVEQCSLTATNQTWLPGKTNNDEFSNCTNGTEGQKVACYAEREWTVWESNPSDRPALLNTYSDGNGYEEWCADFVSYAYKEAGYPLTQGERDGWDEYDANNFQYMDFTMHDAGSYTPKPGDIAFFDYPGGHVEIVASGGQHPTFVYGDSDHIDPVTGNGNMEANTITQEGSRGNVTYYLTPN